MGKMDYWGAEDQENMINIGLVGSGYAAQLHCSGYKKVGGIQVRIKTVCDIDERRARKVAENFNIGMACKNFEEILCLRNRQGNLRRLLVSRRR
ncbi:MAG: hypothetical protein ACUVSK_06020 [Desulfotomaculales bacterium]